MKNFSFNGITKNYITVLRGSNRPAWAPIARVYREIPGGTGVYLNKKRKTQHRPLPIPVYFKAENIADLQKIKEEVAAWLIHDEPKPLIFDDEPDRTYYAVVDGGFDIDEFVRIGSGVIPFVCPDPYKYGAEKTLTIGTSAIVNKGPTETNPIITITFSKAASEFKITHNETGKWVRVIYNFIFGDRVVIDLEKRKITVNNTLKMTSYDWKSQPFKLLPGANTFSFSSSNVSTATIKYRERWL